MKKVVGAALISSPVVLFLVISALANGPLYTLALIGVTALFAGAMVLGAVLMNS